MRISHYLSVAALIFGLAGVAKADSIDFRMSVLDGPITGAFITDSTPFPVAFGNCPANLTAQGALGCFTGVNDTGGTITSIDLTFDNTVSTTDPTDFFNFLNGQTPDCVPSSFFDNVNSPCFLNGAANDPTATYILDFSGGSGIPPVGPGSTFYIAEFDASPDAFQGGTGSVTFTTAATPEPSSILLLFTGIGALGIFAIRQRRSPLSASTRA
jgi:hypothetical protein